MQKISTQNRRALDLVAAKCYYYHARVYEFLDKLDVVRRYGWLGSPWDQSPGHHFCRGVGLESVRNWRVLASVLVTVLLLEETPSPGHLMKENISLGAYLQFQRFDPL